MSNHNDILKVGDWIKGNSRDGELIIGYVESFNILENLVGVTVTKSDHDALAGKTIPLLQTDVKKLPDPHVKNKEQIHYLIDLALATGDEAWFMELSEKLNSMRELVKGV
ncbi:IDEAL domain-containing protein [Mesobacillus subterraneus]|uniref:IDEAL domain-containing protein n=1 Tax=Mesobacillus subterraneus TaxID=285983 RepID=A0A3R9FI95_9BACI|nr:IDEAL domain-containing protein [Mesobacillus subterraneus]RSD28666.1 IDEAL domain-containing protein [Mesobacillus subterraneus]